jgi:pimeloyl-ACP methyl ester carboxylesterase
MTRRIDGPAGALAVHDWGGDGRPVLLVHATGFHGHVWAPIAESLVAEGFHVWSVDQRGHGASDIPERINDWEELGTDVLAIVGELGLSVGGDLVGVGHSSGAVALAMAEASAPGTFERLWLYEPVIIPVDPPLGGGQVNPLAAGARRRRESWPSFEAAIESYGSRPPLNVVRADVLDAYVRNGLVPGDDGLLHLACPPEIEAQVYERMPFHPGYRQLAAVHCPTVVASGAAGGAGSLAEFAPALVERLPDGRPLPMKGLSHFGPLEDPDAVADAILEFIAP